LKIIDSTDYPGYVILFKGMLGRQDYKALYMNPDDGLGEIKKLHGLPQAPETIRVD